MRTEDCPGCGKPLVQRNNRFDCMNPECDIVKVSKGRIIRAAV